MLVARSGTRMTHSAVFRSTSRSSGWVNIAV